MFLTEKLHDVLQTMRMPPPPHPATIAKSRIQNYYNIILHLGKLYDRNILYQHTRVRATGLVRTIITIIIILFSF